MSKKFADVLEKQGIIKEIYNAFNEADPKKQKDLYDNIVDALIKIHVDLSKHNDVMSLDSIKSSLYHSLFSNKRIANLKKNNWKTESKLDGIKNKILFKDVFNKFVEEVEKRLKPFSGFSYKRKNSKEKRILPGNKITARYIKDIMIPSAVKKFYSIDEDKKLTHEEKEVEKIKIARNIAETLKDENYEEIIDVDHAEEFIKQLALSIDYENIKNDLDKLSYIYNDPDDNEKELTPEETKKIKREHLIYKFKEQRINFLTKVKEIIEHNINEENLNEQILRALNSVNFENLNKIANEKSSALEKGIKEILNKERKDEDLKKNVPYLREVKNNTLAILRQGFKDYFIFSAYKLIKKSKLNETAQNNFYKIAKSAVGNLVKNYFLPEILFPTDYSFFYRMLNKRQTSLNRFQIDNLHDLKDELLKTKENIESEVKKQDSETASNESFMLYRDLQKILRHLNPSNENTEKRLNEIETFINKKINKGNKTIIQNIINKYSDKENLGDKEINEIINKLYVAFGAFKEVNTKETPSNKRLPKIPKLADEEGFVKFETPKSYIESLPLTQKRKVESEYYKRYVLDPETQKFIPYIEYALKFYPRSKYEYVKYQEPAHNKFLRDFTNEVNKFGGNYQNKIEWTSKNLATEDGYTLALYGENKEEINTADFKKGKYVKVLE